MLHILKLIFSRYQPGDNPLGLPERKAASGHRAADLDEGLHLVPASGQVMRKREFYENGAIVFEMEETNRATDYGARPKTLTDADIEQLTKRGLNDQVKAAELKILWAAGYTAAEVAAQKRARGYSHRMIETFWAAFNSAKTPTPIAG